MKTYAIVKTHEIALKGKNRPWFMRMLADNLRRSTRGTGVSDVWMGQMLVGLTLRDDADWDLIESRIKDCFGVAKFFRAHRLPKDLDRVKEALTGVLETREFHSFRITANRADKRFHVTSDEINRDLGTFVKDFTGARVDLTNPDLTIFIDVLPKEILLYFHEIRASGGLPVGVSGSVMAMLSGGIDSPVAAWQMMKRGCQAHLVHFHSYPLVDNSSMEKAAELAQFLTRFQHQSSLSLVPLAEIQKQIIVSTPPAYRIILYRRFMVRIAEILSGQVGAKAMVTGESCGQVSSQTLENIFRGEPGGRDANPAAAHRDEQRRDYGPSPDIGNLPHIHPARPRLLQPFRAQTPGDPGGLENRAASGVVGSGRGTCAAGFGPNPDAAV